MPELNDGSKTIEYEISEKFIIGISYIEQTAESEVSGGINELTFTFSNGETATFTVRNGEAGGYPVPVEYAADMVDPEKIYLYLGSEEGYDEGYLYAFLNDAWTKTSLYGVGQDGYSPEVTVSEVEGGVEVRVADRSGITTAMIKNGTATDEQVSDWLDNHPEATTTVQDGSITEAKLAQDVLDLINGGAISDDVKQALLDCFQHVAWIDGDGQNYYDALYNAFYPPAGLVSISAVYTQSGTVYTTDSLDDLRDDLVVTATYDDSSTETVTTYTLSGSLTEGTSTITVSYGGETDTFTVTVSRPGGPALYDWDFTQSLVDSVGSVEAQISSQATRDSSGLHFEQGNACCVLGNVFPPGRTMEIDVASMEKTYTSGHGAFIMFNDSSSASPSGSCNQGVIFRNTNVWAIYKGGWQEGTHTDPEAFSGKTVTVKYYLDNGTYYTDLYMDGNLYERFTSSTRWNNTAGNGGTVQIGNNNNTAYTILITGIRIYEGVE